MKGSCHPWQEPFIVCARLYKAWAEAFVSDYTDDASVVQHGVHKKDRQTGP